MMKVGSVVQVSKDGSRFQVITGYGSYSNEYGKSSYPLMTWVPVWSKDDDERFESHMKERSDRIASIHWLPVSK